MDQLLQLVPTVGLIITALNGYEAITILETQTIFSVIFMDLQMPLLDGYEAMKIIREKSAAGEIDTSQTKFIALSAITKTQFERESHSNLFDLFEVKPVSSERLNLLLRE